MHGQASSRANGEKFAQMKHESAAYVREIPALAAMARLDMIEAILAVNCDTSRNYHPGMAGSACRLA
jgi:hypothetical protein